MKSSQNKKNAKQFLDFLLTDEVQSHLCNNSFETPVIRDVKVDKLTNKFNSNFKEDTSINVSISGERQAEAFKLMKRAGWN